MCVCMCARTQMRRNSDTRQVFIVGAPIARLIFDVSLRVGDENVPPYRSRWKLLGPSVTSGFRACRDVSRFSLLLGRAIKKAFKYQRSHDDATAKEGIERGSRMIETTRAIDIDRSQIREDKETK